MNRFPRETVEFQPVTVKVDGVLVTDGVQLTITSGSTRPTVWAPAVTLDGKIGVMVEGLEVGSYTVWAKVSAVPEVPVVRCGWFAID